MNFPTAIKISPNTLGSELTEAKPMSIEEVAMGRIIRNYPTRFDTFKNLDMLKEYILMTLRNDNFLQKEWLHVDTVQVLPFNLGEQVYYVNNDKNLHITCYEPPISILDDMRKGTSICELDAKSWDIEQLKEIIKRIQNN